MIPDKSIADINIGDDASFERTFTEADVVAFANLSGDHNPLHMDAGYAASTRFGQRVVHGMLVASLCSTLVGMHLPGKRCLYLKQEITFHKPVFIGDILTVSGIVTSKSTVTGILNIAITILKDEIVAMEGMAVVQVMDSKATK